MNMMLLKGNFIQCTWAKLRRKLGFVSSNSQDVTFMLTLFSLLLLCCVFALSKGRWGKNGWEVVISDLIWFIFQLWKSGKFNQIVDKHLNLWPCFKQIKYSKCKHKTDAYFMSRSEAYWRILPHLLIHVIIRH